MEPLYKSFIADGPPHSIVCEYITYKNRHSFTFTSKTVSIAQEIPKPFLCLLARILPRGGRATPKSMSVSVCRVFHTGLLQNLAWDFCSSCGAGVRAAYCFSVQRSPLLWSDSPSYWLSILLKRLGLGLGEVLGKKESNGKEPQNTASSLLADYLIFLLWNQTTPVSMKKAET